MKQEEFRAEIGGILNPVSGGGTTIAEISSVCLALERFADLVLMSATQRRLVSRSQRTGPAVWSHIVDSLHALSLIDPTRDTSLADIGSGNGFPGIPIAIVLPAIKVHLIDRSAGKAEFLEYACASLGLVNAVVHQAELGQALLTRIGPRISTIRATAGHGSVRAALSSFSALPTHSVLVFTTPNTEPEWRERASETGLMLTARHDYRLPGRSDSRSILRLSHN